MSPINRRPPLRRRTNNIPYWVPLLVLVLALCGLAGVGSGLYTQTHDSLVCTVESKDRTSSQSGDSQARVYTKDCGVLEVRDDVFLGKVRSADTYGSILPGKTYEMEVIGFRFGLFSFFPNILTAREVPTT